MPMQSTIKLKYNNVKDGLSEADMYMLSECELIDIGNINLPSQNMKFFGEFSETNIIKIPEFLIDNIFGGCDSHLWIQTVLIFAPTCSLISKGTTSYMILYFHFRYIDDVLSLINSRFGDRIYPFEFEIKDITYTDRSASYLDLHLEIDSAG
jgi:hypothetical protein